MKIYNQILDSSIAEDRRLRLFFIDLLLCADREGLVAMTKEAIARKIKAPVEEVEWGLKELMKEDGKSFTPTENGRRVVPLDGCGYGWKIVNYSMYRDFKSANELRASTNARVERFRSRKRERKRGGGDWKVKGGAGGPTPGETAFVKAVERGEDPNAEDYARTAGDS